MWLVFLRINTVCIIIFCHYCFDITRTMFYFISRFELERLHLAARMIRTNTRHSGIPPEVEMLILFTESLAPPGVYSGRARSFENPNLKPTAISQPQPAAAADPSTTSSTKGALAGSVTIRSVPDGSYTTTVQTTQR